MRVGFALLARRLEQVCLVESLALAGYQHEIIGEYPLHGRRVVRFDGRLVLRIERCNGDLVFCRASRSDQGHRECETCDEEVQCCTHEMLQWVADNRFCQQCGPMPAPLFPLGEEPLAGRCCSCAWANQRAPLRCESTTTNSPSMMREWSLAGEAPVATRCGRASARVRATMPPMNA